MRRALALMIALLTAAPAAAGPWEVTVNPYFMLPTTGGTFGVGRFETDVAASPSELFSRLNWGFMGAVEVNNGNWGVALDANYFNLDASNDDIRRASLNGHQGVYTLTVLKRISREAEVYAGARLTDYGLTLDCNTTCPIPAQLGGGAFSAARSRSKSWVEPVVGFRARLPFSESVGMVFAVDVGGFSVGSDVSVNVWPQVAWKLSERSSVMVGYKLIYVQYDEGEGSERFLFDGITQGPTLGFEFRF